MIIFFFCSHSCTDRPLFNRKCKLCYTEFTNELEENDHMVKHIRGENFLHCNKCFGVFESKKSLMTHLLNCASGGLGKLGLMDVHETIDSISRPTIANSTSSKVQSRIGFIQNKWALAFEQPSGITKNKCNFNPFKDPSSSLLQQNVHRKKNFTCPMCSNTFKSKESLLKHQIDHKSANCPVCFKEFMDIKTLADHIKDVHISNSSSSLTCKLCNKNMRFGSMLTQHLLSHVTSKKRLVFDSNHKSDPKGINQTFSAKRFPKLCTQKVKELNSSGQIPMFNSPNSNNKKVCNETFKLRFARKQNHNYDQSTFVNPNTSNVKDLNDKTLRTSLDKKSNSELKHINQKCNKQNITKQQMGIDFDCNQQDLPDENLKPKFSSHKNMDQNMKKNIRKKPHVTRKQKNNSGKKVSKVNLDSKTKNKVSTPSEKSLVPRQKRNNYYHMKLEVQKSLGFECPVCFQGFLEEAHLSSHVLNKHLTRHIFLNKCSICHKVEPDPKQLCLHMIRHSSKNNSNTTVETSFQAQVYTPVPQNKNIASESHPDKESRRQESCSQTLLGITKTPTPVKSYPVEFENCPIKNSIEMKKEPSQITLDTDGSSDEAVKVIYSVNKFYCTTCKKNFETLAELKEHVVEHV